MFDELIRCDSVASTTMDLRSSSYSSAHSDTAVSEPGSPMNDEQDCIETLVDEASVDEETEKTAENYHSAMRTLESDERPSSATRTQSTQVQAKVGTPLSSKARAFSPRRESSCSTESKMAPTIASAMTALAHTGAVLEVKACQDVQGGWHIMAPMRPESVCLRERALTAVKKALLASSCQGVYVLGHRSWPFHASPSGFAATLCLVENSDDACWSLLSKGHCHKQGWCPWKHPECMAQVKVSLV